MALAPLFATAPHARSGGHAATLGVASGATANGIVCAWLIDTISNFGGFGVVPAILLYAALIAWTTVPFVTTAWLLRRAGPAAPVLLAPALWVSAEFLFPNFFPWRLAYTQREWPMLIQSASVAGPWLLSFAIAWVSSALVTRRLRALAPPALAVLLLAAWGALEIRTEERLEASAGEFRVGIVQGNLSIAQKHSAGDAAKNLAHYRSLSETLQPLPDLVVWPETVVTTAIPRNRALSGTTDPWPGAPVPLLFGAVSYERGDAGLEWYNTLFLRSRDGSLGGRYDKIVLMPFGEFLPFEDMFPGIRTISPHSGDFEAGRGSEVFTLDDGARVGPAICYEDMLPSPLGSSAAEGAQVLVSVANDAWYQGSSALLLHETLGIWRAVENRRYFLRSTNTGLTSGLDPVGRRFFSLPEGEATAAIATVRLRSDSTFYQRAGDWFAWGVLVLAAVLLGWTRRS